MGPRRGGKKPSAAATASAKNKDNITPSRITGDELSAVESPTEPSLVPTPQPVPAIVSPDGSDDRFFAPSPPPSAPSPPPSRQRLLDILRSYPTPTALQNTLKKYNASEGSGWIREDLWHETQKTAGKRLQEVERHVLCYIWGLLKQMRNYSTCNDDLATAFGVTPSIVSSSVMSFFGDSDKGYFNLILAPQLHTPTSRSADGAQGASCVLVSDDTEDCGLRALPEAVLATELVRRLREKNQNSAPLDPAINTVASLVIAHTKSEICTLTCLNAADKTKTESFVRIPVRRKATDQLAREPDRKVPQTLRKAAAILCDFVDYYGGGREGGVELMKLACKEFGLASVPTSEAPKIGVAAMIAIREYCSLSNRETVKVLSFVRKLLGKDFGERLIESRLAHKASEFEKQHRIKVNTVELDLITSASTSETKKCTFYWVENIPRVLEHLMASAILCECFEPSQQFSNYVDKVIFPVGCDKGDKDTGIMTRCANRTRGNTKNHTHPLANYEDGAETYSNLADTIFSKDYPIQPMVQGLFDEKFTMLSLEFALPEDDKKYVRCVSFAPSKMPAKIHAVCDARDCIIHDASNEFCCTESERFYPTTIDIIANDDDENVAYVVLKLIVDHKGSVAGLAVLQGERKLLSYKFDICFPYNKGAAVNVVFRQMIGFPANDGKMSIAVYGIQATGCKHNCFVCGRDQDSTCLPTWQRELHNETRPEKDFSYCDFPLRNGPRSNEKMFAEFEALQHEQGTRKDKTARFNAWNVVNRPLYHIDVLHDPGAILHIPMGVFNHLTDDIRSALRKMETECSSFLSTLREMRNEAKDKLNEVTKSEEYKSLNKKDSDWERKCNGAKSKTDEDYVRRQWMFFRENNSHFAELKKDRQGYTAFINAANEFLCAVDKNVAKRPIGMAEYVFTRGLEKIGGGRYRMEHGGFDMSNGDGMKVIEKWQEIAIAVELCYADTPELRARVADTMLIWRQFSPPLKEFMEILKSQDRVDGAKLEKLKKCVSELSYLFRLHFPGKAPYPKFHFMEAHLVDFASKTGMLGRLSEEGFESTHARVSKFRKMYQSVMRPEQRASLMMSRWSNMLIPDVAQVTLEIQPKSRGQRGSYNKNNHFCREIANEKCAESLVTEAERYAISDRAYIPTAWKESYLYITTSRAPDSWQQLLTGIDTDDAEPGGFDLDDDSIL